MADPDAVDIYRPRASLAAWARQAGVRKRLDGLVLDRTSAALLVWSITRGSLRITHDSTLIRLRPGGTVGVECSCNGERGTIAVRAGVVTCGDASSQGSCVMVLEVPLRTLRYGRTRRPADEGGQSRTAADRVAERLGGGPGWVRANLPDEAVQGLRECVASGALSVAGSNFVVRIDGSQGVVAHCDCDAPGVAGVVADDVSIRCEGSGRNCALTLEIPASSWRSAAT
jgi:hypothetical protein